MSWRISTRHSSIYRYGAPVIASYNETRITPQSTGGQSVLDSGITVTPSTALYSYRDYFSSIVVAFDVPEPHEELVVVGSSTVETASPRPIPTDVGWEELSSDAFKDRFTEYLGSTPYTTGDAELVEIARELQGVRSPLDAVEAASEWIRSSMTYEIGGDGGVDLGDRSLA